MLQEDSHEFLRCLLEKMHRASLRVAGVKEGAPGRLDETTIIHKLFGGYFCNQLHCPNCKYDSNNFEPFLDLCLEVGNGINSVDRALRHFATVETLDADNRWKCPRCEKPVCAKKQMTIRKVCRVACCDLRARVASACDSVCTRCAPRSTHCAAAASAHGPAETFQLCASSWWRWQDGTHAFHDERLWFWRWWPETPGSH
ncbi:hypothetical protein EON66_04375 [archaeon]|nr:MAG: hypothetical protein EON66_04375 [archaeon]